MDNEIDSHIPIILTNLVFHDVETQTAIMRDWFLDRYEDPAERTPYDTAEGRYTYIYGGPYEAEEELRQKFGGYVDNNIIAELVKELEYQCSEWTSTLMYDGWIDDFIEATNFIQVFTESMRKIHELLNIDLEDNSTQKNLNRLLFANVVFALETYLLDAFLGKVLSERQYLVRFIEGNKDLSTRKIDLGTIFSTIDSIEDTIKDYLLSQTWHNISKVQVLYKLTFSCDFPKDISNIYKAIQKRHDIVHRNGKDKEGKEIPISKEDITDLIEDVTKLVDHIDVQLSNSTP